MPPRPETRPTPAGLFAKVFARLANSRTGKVALGVEPLEDRFQPSANAADLLTPEVPYAAAVVRADGAPPASQPAAAAATSELPARRELVLIDSDVPDRVELARDLRAAKFAGTAVEVVELTGGGIAEATAIIGARRGLDAVHVISHAAPGALHLGSDVLDLATLDRYSADLRAWGASLNAGADVLLYGCELAGDAEGRELADRVAALTRADVAASTDPTGSAALGGNWTLEDRTGSVQAAALIDPEWAHTLAAPTGILFATQGNVTGSSTSGLSSWSKGQVVQVGGPNFATEPGTSGGTFSSTFNLGNFGSGSVGIDALHLVRSQVTVGSGSAKMTLLPGDLLLSLNGSATLTGASGSLGVTKDDVIVFRPSSTGNYSAGSFTMLLDNFASITGGNDIWAIAIVEADTLVGDYLLRQGTFLYTRDGGGPDDEIAVFTPTGVGAGRTAGSTEVLIDGSDLGMTPAIRGLDLVTTATTVAGQPLAAGTIVLALDNNATVGANALAVTPYDVFTLSVTKTTLVSGTAVANASLLFQGSDAGLTGAGAKLAAVSLGTASATSAPAAAPGLIVRGDSLIVATDGTVYRIDALTGATIATYGTGLANDGAVVGPDGSLYAADYYNNKVLHYSPTGVLLSSFGGGQLSSPQGLAFGPDGNLYVTNVNSTVQKFSPAGTFLGTFITSGRGGLSNAKGIAWGPDGNAYVSSYSNSKVLKYDGATGALLGTFAAGSGGFEDLAFGPDGNLYVASYGSGAVYRYRGSDGTSLGAAVSGVATVYGVRFDPAGDLVVALRGSGQVRTYDPATGALLRTLATGLANPAYVTDTTSLLTTSAGGTATFSVALASQPTSDVTVTLSSSAPAQGSLSQTVLVFTATNWSTVQTVTVTGLDDGAANGDQTYRITGTATSSDAQYNGLTVAAVPVTNREVTPPNRAPVPAADGYSVNQDTQLSVGAATGLLGNDSDPDGDALSVAGYTQPAHGVVTVASDGSFTYTPAAGYYGTDAFTYTVADGRGGTATGTVSITVNHVNHAPVAGDDHYSTAINLLVLSTPVSVGAPGVLGNDTDADGDALTMELVSGPSNGLFSYNANGSFTYTALLNFSGTDSFTYRAFDGTAYSAPATVSINVFSSNQAPTATADSYTTAEDTQLVVSAPGVLADDSDPDGDTLYAALDTTTAHGALSFRSDGSFAYTPNANYNGTDSFTYHASDGARDSAPVTVTITVAPVNDPPRANGDSATVAEDGSVTIYELANDTDVEGDSLSVTGYTQPAHGALTQNSDGSFTYTPSANYNGPDAFTYTISDGHGGTATATVTITVTAVNDPPTASDDSATAAEDSSATIGVRANGGDVDGDALTVTAVTQGAHGTVLTDGTAISYTPDANFNGVDTFTYTISDGHGGTATATVTMTVTPVNDAPTAGDDSYSTTQNTPVVVPPLGVLTNDADVDGDALSAVLVSLPANGSLSFNPADGSFTYTPNADFTGTDSFTYRAVDPSGATSGTTTVRIRVDAPPPRSPQPAPGGSPAPTGDNSPATPGDPARPLAQGLRLPPTVASASRPGDATAAPLVAAGSAGQASDLSGAASLPGVVGSAGPGNAATVAYITASEPPGPAAFPAAEAKPPLGEVPSTAAKPAPPSDAPAGVPAHVPPVATVSHPEGPAAVAAVAFVELPDIEAAAQSVGEALDRVTRDVEGDADRHAAADAVVSTAAVATAGYVLLNTRAVYWFISALLARPAVWRRFDPVDVIYAWEQERGPARREGQAADEDESLQSMVG